MQNTDSKAAEKQIIDKIKPIYLKAIKYDFALIKLSNNINRDGYFQLYQNLSSLSPVNVCGFNDS